MELILTDEDANRLIKMFKQTLKKYNIQLKENDQGEILLHGIGNKKNGEFRFIYKLSSENKVINFIECKYNYCLFRININNSFHKNSDGTRVQGNRINIFSEEEFNLKGDGKTYMKAFPLPFKDIRNTSDFLELFEDVIKFANIVKNDDLNISIQGSLL
ncbi:DUF6978 family protein [Granulicatella sp.]